MPATVLAVAFAVCVIVAPRLARAGACGGGGEAEIVELELRAKSPSAKPGVAYVDLCWGDFFDELNPRPALAKRFNRACATILAREPADVLCVTASVYQGKREHGGVTLFEAIAGWDRDPWTGVSWALGSDSRTLDLFAKLADPRAAALVIETWRASLPVSVAKERDLVRWEKKTALVRWSRWRQQAAGIVGALGDPTPETLSFLTEQAAATKDRAVKRACLAAVRALNKRAKRSSERSQ